MKSLDASLRIYWNSIFEKCLPLKAVLYIINKNTLRIFYSKLFGLRTMSGHLWRDWPSIKIDDLSPGGIFVPSVQECTCGRMSKLLTTIYVFSDSPSSSLNWLYSLLDLHIVPLNRKYSRFTIATWKKRKVTVMV